jgi:2-keto-3-deoxy-6-phosphogluconate aldolase
MVKKRMLQLITTLMIGAVLLLQVGYSAAKNQPDSQNAAVEETVNTFKVLHGQFISSGGAISSRNYTVYAAAGQITPGTGSSEQYSSCVGLLCNLGEVSGDVNDYEIFLPSIINE